MQFPAVLNLRTIVRVTVVHAGGIPSEFGLYERSQEHDGSKLLDRAVQEVMKLLDRAVQEVTKLLDRAVQVMRKMNPPRIERMEA